MGKEAQFSFLQHANNAINVGEVSYQNHWSLKTIMRAFEMVSILRINFWKSNMYGVNMDQHFFQEAEVFLHWKVASLPFNFLGLLDRVNLRRSCSWDKLVHIF